MVSSPCHCVHRWRTRPDTCSHCVAKGRLNDSAAFNERNSFWVFLMFILGPRWFSVQSEILPHGFRLRYWPQPTCLKCKRAHLLDIASSLSKTLQVALHFIAASVCMSHSRPHPSLNGNHWLTPIVKLSVWRQSGSKYGHQPSRHQQSASARACGSISACLTCNGVARRLKPGAVAAPSHFQWNLKIMTSCGVLVPNAMKFASTLAAGSKIWNIAQIATIICCASVDVPKINGFCLCTQIWPSSLLKIYCGRPCTHA